MRSRSISRVTIRVPQLAGSAKLRARAKLAAAAPKAGRVVPEYGRKEIREVFERSYRILYEITKGAIVVLAVFEGHRRLPDAVGESDD